MSSRPIHLANTVRAMRVALDGDVPAHDAALLVRDDPDPFALVGRWAGGGAIAGSTPVRVAAAGADPFALLADPGPAPADAPPGFVGGGWFGLLGFALGRAVEGASPAPPTHEALPPFALARYDHVLRCDPDGRWWFEALWTGARAAALDDRLTVLRARVAAGVSGPGLVTTTPWRADPSPAGHARAVEACRERIAAGDLYQANLSLRLRSRLTGRPADLFTQAVRTLGPDRAAHLEGAWGAIASLSPELFLTRSGDRVRTAPIKGTRRRDADPAAAARARADLAASAKDRAENVMIVDLMRNDLGRVSVPGTVVVDTLADVRPHPGVWHLVSEVQSRLAPGTDDAALLRATFPPGSVTGAPKRAALDVIAELESASRQAFTGAIGFASPTAGLELSVAIRTFEMRGDAVWLDVGGGIVADSDPAEEAAEALVKARPLLEAIGATVAEAAPAAGLAAVPAPRRLGPRPLPRPDPTLGIFETIAVADGLPAHLGDHLDRLATSVATLYGGGLAGDVVPRAMLAAGGAGAIGPCRLRIVALPDGGLAMHTAPLPVRGPLTLAPVTVPGGLGAHKWLDRRLLDALGADHAPATVLLVDLDGYVLEAAWANVLVVGDDGVLVTPPLDGRILPGVARARMLARARAAGITVRERPLPLEELGAAREVLLTSSLAGALPVGPRGPVGAALARG